MLKRTPEHLRQEIEAGLALHRKHTELSEERLQSYQGSTKAMGIAPDIESHENHYADYVTTVGPKVAYYDPDVDIQSRRPVAHKLIVESLLHGCRRWIHDVRLIETLKIILLDTFFDFGVGVMALEAIPGNEGKERPPMRPNLTRISPRRYFCDPQALGYHSRRFEGHLSTKDVDDMMRARTRDGRRVYDPEVIRKLANAGTDELRDKIDLKRMGIEVVDRDQVVVAECYLPDDRLIYTLGWSDSETGFLRPPRKAFCPPWGPYTMFGVYLVPDQIYPLAPLAIPQALLEEINAQISENARLADQAASFHIVIAPNAKTPMLYRKARNGDIIHQPGFDATQVATIHREGPSRERLDYVDRLRERLDRKTGLTEVQRGNISGDPTAFEVGTAQAASDVRTRFISTQFGLGVERVMETACWYLTYGISVVFSVPVPPSIDAEGGPIQGLWASQSDKQMVDGEFYGGLQDDQEDFDFYDLEIRVDVNSMKMEDNAVERGQWLQFTTWLTGAAAQMLQTPWLDWPTILDMTGDRFNIPNARELVNFPMLVQMIGVQMAAGPVRPDARDGLRPKGEGAKPAHGAAPEPFVIPAGVQAAAA